MRDNPRCCTIGRDPAPAQHGAALSKPWSHDRTHSERRPSSRQLRCLINVLFMVGLLGIGVALALGIAIKPAAVAGATMLVLMWSASLPPSDDLILDNHIIYALLLFGLVAVGAGRTFGLGKRWERIELVQRHRWLA